MKYTGVERRGINHELNFQMGSNIFHSKANIEVEKLLFLNYSHNFPQNIIHKTSLILSGVSYMKQKQIISALHVVLYTITDSLLLGRQLFKEIFKVVTLI